ncbi:MAG: hypothetical protein U0572_08625 [Phycisphaerales bacterium]
MTTQFCNPTTSQFCGPFTGPNGTQCFTPNCTPGYGANYGTGYSNGYGNYGTNYANCGTGGFASNFGSGYCSPYAASYAQTFNQFCPPQFGGSPSFNAWSTPWNGYGNWNSCPTPTNSFAPYAPWNCCPTGFANGWTPNTFYGYGTPTQFGCSGAACPDFTGNGCCMNINNMTCAWTPMGFVPVGFAPTSTNSFSPWCWTPSNTTGSSWGTATPFSTNCWTGTPTSTWNNGTFPWYGTPTATNSPCPMRFTNAWPMIANLMASTPWTGTAYGPWNCSPFANTFNAWNGSSNFGNCGTNWHPFANTFGGNCYAPTYCSPSWNQNCTPAWANNCAPTTNTCWTPTGAPAWCPPTTGNYNASPISPFGGFGPTFMNGTPYGNSAACPTGSTNTGIPSSFANVNKPFTGAPSTGSPNSTQNMTAGNPMGTNAANCGSPFGNDSLCCQPLGRNAA